MSEPTAEPDPFAHRRVDVCCGTMSRVVDSRLSKAYDARIRRRACTVCGDRWSTYETVCEEDQKRRARKAGGGQ